MAEIIFHCGSYKTGSSSIQNFLYEYRATALKNGILYPETGLYDDNPSIGYRHTKLFHIRDGSTHQKIVFNNLIEEIKESNASKVFFSSEAISALQFHPKLKRLVSILQNNGHNISKGVIYLRNRQEYALRYYREYTRRHGNTLNFRRFVGVNRSVFDYLSLCKSLNTILENKIDYWCYENVQDACVHFMTEYVPELNIYLPNKRAEANKGLNAVDIEIIRQMNILVKKKKISKALADKKTTSLLDKHPFGSLQSQHSEQINFPILQSDKNWEINLRNETGFDQQTANLLCQPIQQTTKPIVELSEQIQKYLSKELSV